MADVTNSLAAAMRLTGAVAVGLVDMEIGRCIAGSGIERLDLDAAAEGTTDLLRRKIRLLQELDLHEEIEEMITTSDDQIHLIRPVRGKEGAGLFFFLAFDQSKADLGLTRYKLAQIEKELTL